MPAGGFFRGRSSAEWALVVGIVLLIPFAYAITVHGQNLRGPTDPGVRGGTAGAGGAIAGLTTAQTSYFTEGQTIFNETVSVTGSDPGTRLGLGPRFDSNSCMSCHFQPTSGGSSPLTTEVNQQIVSASRDGATNVIPSFIFQGGPTREARFVFMPDGVTPDGSVHNIFTITGRTDAGSCDISQPDFPGNLAKNNVIFRIASPTFGDGLLEMVQNLDMTAQAAYECSNPISGVTGICGVPNPAPTGEEFGKFGWKAQDPSVLQFTGEASNIELGVTNEVNVNERDETPACVLNGIPEDHTTFVTSGAGAMIPSGVANMSFFMRFLAQPVPGTCPSGNSSSCTNGAKQFQAIGCALCHRASYTTAQSSVTALSGVKAQDYSDLLLHHMGPGLADCVTQGAATGDMFRTAPLWNVGQRVFFMHDGRTTDIVQAIEAHLTTAGTATCGITFGNSEANPVINNFNALPEKDQQDLVNFLRSL
jgi:CxxC motif-containing protein (DUF1111 family)